MHYKSLAISDPQELTFGLAPKPVTTLSGMVIGGGTVYPELNFTLPTMSIDAGTMPEVRRNYEQIIEGFCCLFCKLNLICHSAFLRRSGNNAFHRRAP